MKTKNIHQGICYFLLIFGLGLLIPGCENNEGPVPALITTDTIRNITLNSALAGGNVYLDGGAAVTERGVCWSINIEPTISDNKTIDGAGMGDFLSPISGLTPSTTYYVRAYAINSAGTSYGNFKTFTTQVMDEDNNLYNSVTIGNQVWMTDNLRTTKFNDGEDIPLVTEDTAWVNLNSAAYCWYNNDKIIYGGNYGALYNWNAVNSGKLAPIGWHVATYDEWIELANFLGTELVAGGKLKEIGISRWNDPNTGATNEVGFKALPGGMRSHSSGTFSGAGITGTWWSLSDGYLWAWSMNYNSLALNKDTVAGNSAFSVRCVKD